MINEIKNLKNAFGTTAFLCPKVSNDDRTVLCMYTRI